jgi:acyl-[acyl carrier protein]--UDP-N-acetylglucosamine O-acyltransferase
MENKDHKTTKEIVDFVSKNNLELSHSISSLKKLYITFCDDINFTREINYKKNIIGVITTTDIAKKFKSKTVWAVNDPRTIFFSVQNKTLDKFLNLKTKIGKNLKRKPTTFIENKGVIIGNNVTLGHGVIICAGTTIGDNCKIGPYSCLGGEGYQYQRTIKSKSEILSVRHTGGVSIGDGVDIKEFCSIHRALFSWDLTVIDDNSKIDSNSHIGHGCKVGKSVFLCSHSNLSGNNFVGDNSYIGPGANVPNRITIQSNVKLSIGSTVTTDIEKNKHYTGNFAIPHHKFIGQLKKIIKNEKK